MRVDISPYKRNILCTISHIVAINTLGPLSKTNVIFVQFLNWGKPNHTIKRLQLWKGHGHDLASLAMSESDLSKRHLSFTPFIGRYCIKHSLYGKTKSEPMHAVVIN